MAKPDSYGRYHQQILLNGFGEDAQLKLSQARVLVIGAGGLGCAALQYLAAAGTGTIGIADDDTVQLSNLNRQVIYSVNDIGHYKAEKAAGWLRLLNPEIDIQFYNVRLTPRNILEILDRYDIVLDGTDNTVSKYLINDACVLTGKPDVYAAISQFEGQVAVFNYTSQGIKSANYRDFFPLPPLPDQDVSCRESGVIGVLTGIIGSIQCSETIKLITGLGNPLINSILTFNALTNELHKFVARASPENLFHIPADRNEFMRTDYNYLLTCDSRDQLELEASEFNRLINRENITVIDVREHDHRLSPVDFQHIHIPYGQLRENLPTITGDTVITFCEKGILSLQAARLLKEAWGPAKKIYSLRKGICHWNQTRRNSFCYER